ncbi:Alternative oxidase, mitochondrial,Ubiquinol oxidase 1c, mitochondrial,Ubiquinol oxidase 1, mitochondrial,Alternative oxidase 3, mitochondrial,Alternative oxidase 1, mitochondrial,Ubiquinol oxidase 2, mitochondrial,Ubiquinol oxidase 1a, mitochondrial,Ubiquinol oxidase 3, mitochondrial,Alternative oxidase 2, mitochondrial,Ubiquinol oxidase, mitochondrial,Ubiquinol oxidase 1b, mitochondrial [Mytilus edulis]|uniref:Alternative oxidase n=2 Tax=Mytilus TaxID=6548 RepID=A0A8S3SQV8_MYTED|nr:Alternative oxidase, mitochondrial,Ubiquinol oxidase 1c, mitochondrial,Ubiquinol oxidase 1, mitochondrial,Alternative oxidase 3, mitochondrial,Alternative oxidase 1, mitochondrial,Ubiquinol oxidase 2, mitochondrial,Ubiquinol oxidase 1a, mitochondrial,Ubiquinol oxidase 3, mitochondrial,Alternative oxidase 2, mitochondrial,Ubiquinol oxidase, mitochondrial,Ubiquinol oxidase 1b, mitochondrial [Mytilus edulis]
MYVLRSVCRCGLHSQGLIKQITMGKPFWTTNMYSASSIQGVYVQVRNLGTKDEVDENVKKFRSGNYETIPDPQRLQHFKKSQENIPTTSKDETPPIGANALPHPIWSEEEVHNVEVTHKPPEGKVDKMAYYTVKLMRGSFDILSGFNRGERNERKWVLRICFLETVAGVPGMVAAMLRHLSSLRRMQRDYGWIHTLLEEAENERMHLMTALQLRKPTKIFRLGVVVSQGAFVTMFSLAYLISPRFCHRFVGYLEEEAVITYTKCVQDIHNGSMEHWKTQPAPESAITYWKLPDDAKMLDVILAIRADEAHHRVVNHTLASLKEDDYNPYKPGE